MFLSYLEKYDYVGRLLKPGESHSYYTDEEGSPTNKLHLGNPKQFEPDQQIITNTEIDSLDNDELEKAESKDDIIYDSNYDDQLLKNTNENTNGTNSLDGSPEKDDNYTLEK